MSGKLYPEDFIIKAEKQFIERALSFPSAATLFNIPPHSLSA
ncbi:hypothetical protein [Salmonella enterica]|nr:hypothetical protein [Salmonella enterica]